MSNTEKRIDWNPEHTDTSPEAWWRGEKGGERRKERTEALWALAEDRRKEWGLTRKQMVAALMEFADDVARGPEGKRAGQMALDLVLTTMSGPHAMKTVPSLRRRAMTLMGQIFKNEKEEHSRFKRRRKNAEAKENQT